MVLGRRVGALVSGFVLCALAAACTGAPVEPSGSSTSESPSPSTSSTAKEPVTITFAVYGPKAGLRAYEELAAAFRVLNPHITVKLVNSPDADAAMASLRARTTGGSAPDVFLIDHEHFAEVVEDGLAQPVDALLEERQVDFGDGYQRSGLTAFAADAALQCMPHDVSPVVVYYNKDLVNLSTLVVEDEEPPSALDGWNWESFSLAARQAAAGPTAGLYVEPSLSSVAPFIWSKGGDLVDDAQAPTTLTLSDGDARAALEELLALVRDPEVTPTPAELAKADPVTLFKRGRLGMILGTRALTPELRKAKDLDFDVMPLPSMGRFRTISDMTGYCISAKSEQTEAAADFLAYAVGREGAAITARTGYVVPSNLEVANSVAFTQPSKQPESSFIFNEGVRRAQGLPAIRGWSSVSNQVRPLFERMFYAPVIDLETLLEQVDTTSQQVLAPEAEE